MKLSVVMAGRNDLYGGGDFLARFNRCLDSVVPLGCEIIVVEWNPPKDRPTFIETIRHKGIHLITVSRDVHDWQHGSEFMAMFEYRAKNVGIRRAKSDWILVMNSDIVLSEEMQKRLCGPMGVSSPCVYTAPRHDMHGDRLVQVCEGPGDFVLMHRSSWFELRGYLDLVSYTHIDSLLLWTAKHFGITKTIMEEPIIHHEHDRSEQSTRWGIHSSDMPKFIGQKNEENWGLCGVTLSETTT